VGAGRQGRAWQPALRAPLAGLPLTARPQTPCSAEVKAGTKPRHNPCVESMVTRGPLSTISAYLRVEAPADEMPEAVQREARYGSRCPSGRGGAYDCAAV
jgi:hypothetical protein